MWISARQERVSHDGTLLTLDNAARSLDDVVTRLMHQLSLDHLAGQSTTDKLAGLRSVLADAPYLVVIDNLETLTDSRDLIPALYPLSGITRFLLTSRHSLHDHEFIQASAVPPLSLNDSYRLIQSELARRGRDALWDTADMQSLYDVVGGVPLALKLIAAQMPYIPLEHLLEGLRRSASRMSESMFTYIYYRTWQLLDDSARRLLLSMLTLSLDGEDVAWIRLMSDLPEEQFERSLSDLLNYNLLQVSGPLSEPLYHLHRLTVTFLHSDLLLNWQAGDLSDD